MKRILVMLSAVLCLAISTGTCQASWGAAFYSGYQPWWNIFAKRYKCMTPEEERLQKFWHDYYDAMKHFYGALDRIDWVAYYKNHGYQINGGCGMGGCGRINYAPVFVTPGLQWAVPASMAGGPPVGPPYGGHGGHGHHGFPMFPGAGHGHMAGMMMPGMMPYPAGVPAEGASVPVNTSTPAGNGNGNGSGNGNGTPQGPTSMLLPPGGPR